LKNNCRQDKEKIRPFDIIVGLKNISYLEKLLLFKINNLDNDKDGCYARDDWFADLFKVHIKSINRCISNLEKKGLISKRHPNGYHVSNSGVTANQPNGYPSSNPTVDYITKDITKEREYSSHADFINDSFKNEVDELKSLMPMSKSEYNKYLDYFNEQCSKQNITINKTKLSMFKRIYGNWHSYCKKDLNNSNYKPLQSMD
jgi:DNA-binding transcriptional regulator YhcF (GntR family)